MVDFLKWYLLITILGWLTFPIAFRFFPNLKDRGFAFSRVLGLLLWGYAFWLFGSFQILQNDLAGQTVALLIVCGFSLFFAIRNWTAIKAWARQNIATILIIEGVFLALFAGWVLVRPANPVVAGKKNQWNWRLSMPSCYFSFPANYLWLSGYAISDYYFGYVIISMLARITGVANRCGIQPGSCRLVCACRPWRLRLDPQFIIRLASCSQREDSYKLFLVTAWTLLPVGREQC